MRCHSIFSQNTIEYSRIGGLHVKLSPCLCHLVLFLLARMLWCVLWFCKTHNCGRQIPMVLRVRVLAISNLSDLLYETTQRDGNEAMLELPWLSRWPSLQIWPVHFRVLPYPLKFSRHFLIASQLCSFVIRLKQVVWLVSMRVSGNLEVCNVRLDIWRSGCSGSFWTILQLSACTSSLLFLK